MPRRWMCLFVALLVAVTSIALTGAPGARAATVHPGADPKHPYSKPVWFPLHVPTYSSCYKSNPGCNGYHGYWGMDIGLQGARDKTLPFSTFVPVYPMGAGVVQSITGTNRCGDGQPGIRITIDHGGGVVSIYGHVRDVQVHVGDYVATRTALASAGNSGYNNCKRLPNFRYLFLAIKHGRTYVPATHLYACTRSGQQSWPQSFGYRDWNVIPDGSLSMPSVSGSCLPASVRSPDQPASVAVSRPTNGQLRFAWSPEDNTRRVTAVRVEFQQYHPTIKRYTTSVTRTFHPGRSTTFSGLDRYHRFRAVVRFYNPVGWSLARISRSVTGAV